MKKEKAASLKKVHGRARMTVPNQKMTDDELDKVNNNVHLTLEYMIH